MGPFNCGCDFSLLWPIKELIREKEPFRTLTVCDLHVALFYFYFYYTSRPSVPDI